MRLENAVKDFTEIKQILDELEIPFFLIAGSALGAYRDKQLMAPGSDSLGIGIFTDSEELKTAKQSNQIRQKLIEKGFTMDDERTTILQFCKLVQTMIYFFVKTEECWASYSFEGNRYLCFPLRFTEIEEIEARGFKVKVLKPIEDYLTWGYGNWKVFNPAQHIKLWKPS